MATKWEVKITGEKEMLAKLMKYQKDYKKAFAKALYKAAEKIMTKSKRDYVPVDLGALRSSGHVSSPRISKVNVTVQLSYGGPSAPYAIVQHENLDYAHTVGEAKYLEKPMMEAMKTLASDLVNDIDKEINIIF